MPLVNPAETLNDAPLTDIIVLLLKQVKRLLAEHDVMLTTDDMNTLARDAAAHHALPASANGMLPILRDLVTESLAVLQTQFGYTFETSLTKDMSDVQGWETTSEFLELANEKGNAELRISTTAALLTLMGDAAYAPLCLAVIAADPGITDVDATIARRALLHLTGVAPDAPDWLAQVQHHLQG
jgi:hypothetical protein